MEVEIDECLSCSLALATLAARPNALARAPAPADGPLVRAHLAELRPDHKTSVALEVRAVIRLFEHCVHRLQPVLTILCPTSTSPGGHTFSILDITTPDAF
jgi:hypothetical protein